MTAPGTKSTLHLLIVEDSESDAALIVRVFERSGHQVEHRRVFKTDDFRQALQEREWHAVICDYSMPGFDGAEALALYQASDLDIPFIVVSGAVGESIAVEMMRKGADDYLLKDNLIRLVPATLRAIENARVRQQRERSRVAHEISEERYSLATRATNDGIWDVDLVRHRVWWNTTYDRLWGRRPVKTNGSPQWWFDHIHPEDLARVKESFTEAIAGSAELWQCEYRYRRTDGAYRHVRDRAFISRNDEGTATRILGAMSDVTELHLREQALRELARRTQTIREDERKHIAREIHDQLGQVMTVLKMNLTEIENDLQRLPATDLRNHIEDHVVGTTEIIDNTIESVRAIARRLRPSVFDELGVAAAIAQECEGFEARRKIICSFVVSENFPKLPEDVETALFRLAQEFLTNIERHARAKTVNVRLEVADDGVGFNKDAARTGGHLGLVGARERTENLGGVMEIKTGSDTGTLVVITLPIDND